MRRNSVLVLEDDGEGAPPDFLFWHHERDIVCTLGTATRHNFLHFVRSQTDGPP